MNKAELKKYKRKYYLKNKEKTLLKNKEYWVKNKERLNYWQRTYYKKNKGKLIEQRNKFNKKDKIKHPEKYKKREKIKHLKKKELHSKKIIDFLIENSNKITNLNVKRLILEYTKNVNNLYWEQKLRVLICDILWELKIKHHAEYPIMFNNKKKYIDIIIPSRKIAIETKGFWGSLFKKMKVLDRNRWVELNKIKELKGYKVVLIKTTYKKHNLFEFLTKYFKELFI